MSRQRRRPSAAAPAGGRLRLGVILFLPVLVSGCLETPATRQSEQVEGLYRIFSIAAAVLLAIVWGLLTWAILRYRSRGRDADAEPPQIRGDARLESIWTIGPVITVAVLFALTIITLGEIQARPPDPAVRLQVSGFQWGWRFDYLDDGVEIEGTGVPGPEIVLPVGEPIELTVTGMDVIHSFYVPRFLVKYDAIPGREYTAPLTIQQPGTYAGQCAEFCGLYHSQMGFSIRAVPMAEYRDWMADQRDRVG